MVCVWASADAPQRPAFGAIYREIEFDPIAAIEEDPNRCIPISLEHRVHPCLPASALAWYQVSTSGSRRNESALYDPDRASSGTVTYVSEGSGFGLVLLFDTRLFR